jgi:creatinine amidohydrolase/Fe(II)-dependent formamide hydrolase-like protein
MPEFQAAVARNPWLILPVGTTEEHGPHLPLGADTVQAERIAAAVAERTGALVAAPIPYGLCRTTRNFPGTISISYETVERLAVEILQGFAAQGLRRFLVFSGHAGGAHMVALRQAALRLVPEDLARERFFIPVAASDGHDRHQVPWQRTGRWGGDPDAVDGGHGRTPRGAGPGCCSW